MVRQKYRLLFSPKHLARPGPKGPTADLIQAVVEMKQRNRSWGCPRIAEQINLAFGTSVDKDVVRRTLVFHHRPAPDSGGPSWLTFLGHMKDSLWSLYLFRCESAGLRTHWVLMVMDQYTRRIIGFGIQAGVVDGDALCRMFKQAIQAAVVRKTSIPRRNGIAPMRCRLCDPAEHADEFNEVVKFNLRRILRLVRLPAFEP